MAGISDPVIPGVPNTATPAANLTGPTIPLGTFKPTDGWYVFGFCVFMVLTANTKIAPIIVGVGGLALIFQTSLLLQGK